MDPNGNVEVLMDSTSKSLLDTYIDEAGMAFTVIDQETQTVEVWYSEGTSVNTRRIAELSPSDEVRQIERIGDNLLTITTNPSSTGSLLSIPLQLVGDLSMDGRYNGADVDELFTAIRAEDPDPRFDLNQDQNVNAADVDSLIRDAANTRLGDFDFNGKVEFADFLVLSTNFEKSEVGYAEGDANGDHTVNFEDFLLFSAEFGFQRS